LPLAPETTSSRDEVSGVARLSAAVQARKILVVDDNADAATSLALLLEFGGAEVKTAADGAEAIEVAHAFGPELILMDVGMPNIDGLEATRRIRQLPFGKQMRIVAVTGWGQSADREKTKAAGFDAHLVKPVSAEELQRILFSE
ncbi:MAG TPA: response regulator, partial [Steroidobacteraceae bacterium]|nr:response regulator [Steroidobacteraceae bacterium]